MGKMSLNEFVEAHVYEFNILQAKSRASAWFFMMEFNPNKLRLSDRLHSYWAAFLAPRN
jgi:hypothetical protein